MTAFGFRVLQGQPRLEASLCHALPPILRVTPWRLIFAAARHGSSLVSGAGGFGVLTGGGLAICPGQPRAAVNDHVLVS